MVEHQYYIRSYNVSPGVRGSPKLTVLTDKQKLAYTDSSMIHSLIRCAIPGTPFRAKITTRETPTGGKFQIFERID